MKKTILAAAAIFAASAAPSFAQSYDDPGNSDTRQENQVQRIQQGVRTGELTDGETRNLVRQQNRIDQYQDRAVSDGYLSRSEQNKLDRMQDRASNRIHNKKNNYRER